MKNLLIRLTAVLLSLLVCFLSLKFYIEKQETDIHIRPNAFLYWSIPLALAMAVSGSSILSLFGKRSFLFKVVLIAVCSIGISILWQFGLEQLVNMQAGAYKEPMLYTWAGATVLELLALELLLKKSDNKKEPAVVALGLISFPLIAVISILVMSLFNGLVISASAPDAETYLIPADFKGEFRVIYDEENGIEPNVVDGRKVMKIPENGVLVVKSPYYAGKIDQEFYLVDKKGMKTQVSSILKYEDRKKSTGVLCYGPGISLQQGKYKGLKAKVLDFTLYRKNENLENDGDYSRLDSLTALSLLEIRK